MQLLLGGREMGGLSELVESTEEVELTEET